MENAQLIAVLASIVLQASPLIIAVCGEIPDRTLRRGQPVARRRCSWRP